MKKLTILLITFFIIYFIYSLFSIHKINYVSLSDNILNEFNYIVEKDKLFNNYSFFTNSSVIKTYQDIKNNRTIRIDNHHYYLKKELRESDILVISVGMEELVNNFDKYNMKINYEYFDNMFSNIERLIKEVKKYAYGKIIFIGYYNPTSYYDANVDRFFYDTNIKLSRLMLDNNIIYLDLYELVKGNSFKDKNSIYLNSDGNKRISSIIKFYCTS